MIRLAALALCASGCTMGFGSAYVGQWRAHQEPRFDTCRADADNHCLEAKHVMAEVPARSYWGVAIAFPAMGVSEVTQGNESHTRIRVEPSLEVLRGRGALALGLRAGMALDGGVTKADTATAMMLPVDVVGHLSFSERFGIYGGLGYVPYARTNGMSTALGGRALFGAQLALVHDLEERYIAVSLEASQTWLHLDGYRSTAVTTNIGVYF